MPELGASVELPKKPDGTPYPRKNVDLCKKLFAQIDGLLLEDIKKCVPRKAEWMFGDATLGICLLAQLHPKKTYMFEQTEKFNFHEGNRKKVLGQLAELGTNARAVFLTWNERTGNTRDYLIVMKYVDFDAKTDNWKGKSLGVPLLCYNTPDWYNEFVLLPDEEWVDGQLI